MNMQLRQRLARVKPFRLKKSQILAFLLLKKPEFQNVASKKIKLATLFHSPLSQSSLT